MTLCSRLQARAAAWLCAAPAAATLLLSSLAAPAVLAQAQPAPAAAPWPTGPVTLVVPFAAGSGTDAVARVVARRLGERLKQNVVVDNKAGASAQIAAQLVAKARPDGYTLFMTTNTSHSANPALFASLKYDPIKDFTPVTRVGELPFALLVAAGHPARSLKDLVDQARAQPGRLSYATPNSSSLVASETLKRMAGIDVVGVPYKSSPQALTDLIGGQVQLYVADLGSSLGMIKADKVRPLAVTTGRPVKGLPGVPSMAATLPGFDLTSWNGIFGPAGLPPAVVERLNTEILALLDEKDVQDQLAQLGFEVWPSRTPVEFARYVEAQLVHWTDLIRRAGIRPE